MTRRLWVGNLPFSTTSTDLKLAAEEHGHVLWARITRDHEQEHEPSKGYGFIEAQTDNDADLILEGLRNMTIGGRTPRVSFSESSESARGLNR